MGIMSRHQPLRCSATTALWPACRVLLIRNPRKVGVTAAEDKGGEQRFHIREAEENATSPLHRGGSVDIAVL